MEPPSAQSPFAQCRYYPPLGRRTRRLLRGHYSSVIAPTDSFANPVWLFFPSALASCKKSSQVAPSPCCQPGPSRRYLCESFLGCLVPYHGGPTECVYLFLPPCHRPSPREVWVGFPLLSANTTSRGGVFEAADISLCSGLRVCSSPRSFLPLLKVPQGSRDFYIRAERASLPLHAPDMLAVRIQAIDDPRSDPVGRDLSDRYVVTSLRHYLNRCSPKGGSIKPNLAKDAKMNLYLGGDSVSTEAVAARRHAGTHLPVTWWKLEMPTTTWHLLLN